MMGGTKGQIKMCLHAKSVAIKFQNVFSLLCGGALSKD